VIDDIEENNNAVDLQDDGKVKLRPKPLDLKQVKTVVKMLDPSEVTPALYGLSALPSLNRHTSLLRFKNITKTKDILVGECHINFEKLINNIISYANVDDNKGVIFGETLVQEFTENLWYCGHSIGEVRGMIKMENMPFISQMKIGVLDNNGVSYCTKTFSGNDKAWASGQKKKE
jgi:hypothetical protein